MVWYGRLGRDSLGDRQEELRDPEQAEQLLTLWGVSTLRKSFSGEREGEGARLLTFERRASVLRPSSLGPYAPAMSTRSEVADVHFINSLIGVSCPAERMVDLVSYERVITDMTTKRQLKPFGGEQAITLVIMCRDVTRADCERLRAIVEDLEKVVLQ